MSRIPVIVVTLLAVVLMEGLGRPSSVAAQTYVIDDDAGTGAFGALFRVDPTTGARTLLSDFGVGPNQGVGPLGVAVEAGGSILVIDDDAGTGVLGALFRVDPTTGARTLLSDFGVGPNQGVNPGGVAVEAGGSILVSDDQVGALNQGALFRVDPTTGARTLLSDFGVGPNQGVDPRGIAIKAGGSILVGDRGAGTGGNGALFRVDPTTGARTLLSDFGVGANPGVDPYGVVIEAGGSILVIDRDAGTGGNGALFRVDPTTGARTLLSDFGVGPNQGVDPLGVAVEAGGSILVSDRNAGTGGNGALFRVDPTTGARTLLSDFGVGANPGVSPRGVAVSAAPAATAAPALSEWAQIGMAALLVGGGLLAIRKRSAAVGVSVA